MAINNLKAIQQQLLELALKSLRPQLLNFRETFNYKYDPIPGQKRSIVEIPFSVARETPYNIVPGHLPIAPGTQTMGQKQISCDQWIGLSFGLDDVESLESGIRAMPVQMQEVVNSIAARMTLDGVTALHRAAYTASGAIGSIPFSAGLGTRSITNPRKRLKQNYTPMTRGMIKALLTEDSEEEALNLEAFQRKDYRPGQETSMETGMMGEAFRTQFYCPQVMPEQAAAVAAGWTTSNPLPAGPQLNGDKCLEANTVALAAGAGDWMPGDMFTLASSNQNYTVDSWDSATSILTFYPAPEVAIPAGDALTATHTADYTSNLVFHRDAVGFVTRPLKEASKLANTTTAVDELTGIVLTLESSRQYNQDFHELKVLYGFGAVRREFVCRLLQ